MGEGGAIALASVLQQDRAALTDLFLSRTTDGEGLDSGPPIGDRGAMAIAVALRSNTRLRTLDLRDQHISTQGALALGDMLRTNTHLELLTLSENPIGFQGVRTPSAPATGAEEKEICVHAGGVPHQLCCGELCWTKPHTPRSTAAKGASACTPLGSPHLIGARHRRGAAEQHGAPWPVPVSLRPRRRRSA